MENRDDLLRLQVKTKADRPVMNAQDTPEYINLATHYQERKAREEGYESLQFTDDSMNYLPPLEDEDLLNGNVKPVVKSGTSHDAFSTPVKQSEDYVPPYRDIPGKYATVGDPVFYKEKRSERYVLVPVSLIPFYNPIILSFAALMLVLLIIVEVIGLIYVF
ncbi:MAG: hypothetical protein J6U23_09755 [Clostridiales bacterium]|nr:hypothetical protein [Clostridiales bacterium]